MMLNVLARCSVLLLLMSTVMSVKNKEANDTDITVRTSRVEVRNSAGTSMSAEENTIEEVKRELDRAVQGFNSTVIQTRDKLTNAISDVAANLDSCKAKDCNNRGTCLGTKKAYVCACVLGYTGKNCEDTMCESSRDCNGRGICFGTTNSLTCLCNLGYRGPHCEEAV